MYLLPILAGILFGVIGLAYRLGQARGVTTPMVMVYVSLAGCFFFGVKMGAHGFGAPPLVWVLGIASGLAQYVMMELIAAALVRGPLSPIWCAINLVFVPVIIYAALYLGESLNILKLLGIAAAIASVVCGSIRPRDASHSASKFRMGPYLVILIAALLCNSVLHGSVKHLKTVGLMDNCGNLFFLLMYAMVGLPIVIKLSFAGFGRTFSPAGIGTGLLAAFGSIAGFSCLAAASQYPAAIVFTFSAIFSLITGSLISVAFFKEKITPPWIAMIALAVVAVVMVGVKT